MNPLEILHSTEKPWLSQFEIMMQMGRQAFLVPTLLRKLEERELAVSRADDEGGRVYQITVAGILHFEDTTAQKKISSFPPPRSWESPRISWPPAAA